MGTISQRQLQNQPIIRAGFAVQGETDLGMTDGWMPVFDTPQTGVAAVTTEAAPASGIVPSGATGIIDLRAADGFQLEVVGVPSAGTFRFGMAVQLLKPYKSDPAGRPVAFRYTQVYFNTGNVLNTSFGVGDLAGNFGVTSAHRYSAGSTFAGTGVTYFIGYPNTTSNRHILHVFAARNQYARVILWDISSEATALQAFWSPLFGPRSSIVQST